MGRLEWELQQRKQLASQCRQLESEKEKVASEIVSKQERLDKLAPQLSHILDVIKPLQEHLGLPNDMTRQEHQLAHLLPNPLYLLYAKVDAYTQVYGTYVVTIKYRLAIVIYFVFFYFYLFQGYVTFLVYSEFIRILC